MPVHPLSAKRAASRERRRLLLLAGGILVVLLLVMMNSSGLGRSVGRTPPRDAAARHVGKAADDVDAPAGVMTAQPTRPPTLAESDHAKRIPKHPLPRLVPFDCGAMMLDIAERELMCSAGGKHSSDTEEEIQDGSATMNHEFKVIHNILYVRRTSFGDAQQQGGEEAEADEQQQDGSDEPVHGQLLTGGAMDTDMPEQDRAQLPNVAVDRFVVVRNAYNPDFVAQPAPPRAPRKKRTRPPRAPIPTPAPRAAKRLREGATAAPTPVPRTPRPWAPPRVKAAPPTPQPPITPSPTPPPAPPLLGKDLVEVAPSRFLRLRAKMNYRAKFGFAVSLSTCLSNFWHGNTEFVLPLFGLLRAYNLVGAKPPVAYARMHQKAMETVRSNVDDSSTFTNNNTSPPIEAPNEVNVPFVIFARAPSRRQWGRGNAGCPSLNSFPYGMGSSAGWMLRSLLGLPINAKEGVAAFASGESVLSKGTDLRSTPIVFFDERGEHRKYLGGTSVQPTNASIVVDTMILDDIHGGAVGKSAPSMAKDASDDGEGQTPSTPADADKKNSSLLDQIPVFAPTQCFGGPSIPYPPEPSKYPYFRNPFSYNNIRCVKQLQAARLFFRRRVHEVGTGIGKGSEDDGVEDMKKDVKDPVEKLFGEPVVTVEELQCPTVIMADRQGSGNGRDLSNYIEVVDTFRKLVPKCGTFKTLQFDAMNPFEQVEAASGATIFIVVRGAAAVNTLFLRPGAGLLTLSPGLFSVPISVARDNYPWYPLPTFRTDVPTALGVCTASPVADTRADNPYVGMCLRRSVNFCNMKCSPTHIQRVFRDLSMSMEEWHGHREKMALLLVREDMGAAITKAKDGNMAPLQAVAKDIEEMASAVRVVTVPTTVEHRNGAENQLLYRASEAN